MTVNLREECNKEGLRRSIMMEEKRSGYMALRGGRQSGSANEGWEQKRRGGTIKL